MTNRAKAKEANKEAKTAADAAPLDGAQALAAIRERIARKLMVTLGHPSRCRDRRCRRVKRCVGPTMRCADDFPKPPMTAEEASAALARFQVALKRRIAERAPL